MAVVQISRIQIRRGRKNQGSGLPQLASGELGWAVDTQELFIGNGSVAEGAPYVGNTKLLTEHDNLFQYASNYGYKSDEGWMDTGEVVRTLQARLDDKVSVRSFGCAGDSSDQTIELQRAVDQLFINDASKTNPQSRVILVVEPGIYTISSTIYVPPYATILGAGSDKTIFVFTGTGAAFETVNGTSTPGNPASDAVSTTLNQARHIKFEGCSIQVPLGRIGLRLQSCKNSYFKDIEISSYWSNGDALSTASTAIMMNSLSSAVGSNNNHFDNVSVRNFSYGVYSDWDIYDNQWISCRYEALGKGILFGAATILGISGQISGPFNNVITSSEFQDIDFQGLHIVNGTGNLSVKNRYYRVGNAGGSALNPVSAIVEFDQNGNHSENDWFERSNDLGSNPAYILNVPYIPEVAGHAITDYSFTQSLRITEYGEYTKLFRLPADVARSAEIEYIYKSNQVNAVRNGTLRIVVDPTNDLQTLTDDYEFIGDSLYEENLVFKAQTYDENADTTVDTIAVMVLNSTSSDDAEFYYRVKSKA